MPAPAALKQYYQLAKPGIVYGNALYVIGGFFLATAGDVSWLLLLYTLAGISLIIAAGCVYNNYLDQGIDAKMERTKNRPLLRGDISGRSALIYATALAVLGFVVLTLHTNTLPVMLGIVALVLYVGAYGVAKRRTVYGTLVGAIPGALPPVAAYTAVTGRLDSGALVLFAIIAIWQVPHFYAIAMYRLQEYKAAHLPVLPAVYGMQVTRVHILLYIALFTVVAPLLTFLGYAGKMYAASVLILGLAWLYRGFSTYKTKPDAAWARDMFFFSLIVTIGLTLSLAVGPLLP